MGIDSLDVPIVGLDLLLHADVQLQESHAAGLVLAVILGLAEWQLLLDPRLDLVGVGVELWKEIVKWFEERYFGCIMYFLEWKYCNMSDAAKCE